MTNKLFVAGLSYYVTDDLLKKHFETVGKVLSANAIIDRNTGQCKGFGFVEMETEEEAKIAIDKLNNTMLDNRSIIVKEARPQEDRDKNRSFDRNNNNRGYKRSDRY